jgi:chromosome segregation ATPase
MKFSRASLNILFLLIVISISGCQSAYYGALEKAGYHKRDILVTRVEKAQESQTEAKEQFASALEQFSSVVNFDGGSLEDRYNALNSEFEKSEARAEDVSQRIDSVQSVAEALFDEWEDELDAYSSQNLRRQSERQLKNTNRKYEGLISAMRKAEERIDPVLDAFRDNVLYLKHNLNARAVSALKGELVTVEQDVAGLILEMEKSISEADEFIKTLGQQA